MPKLSPLQFQASTNATSYTTTRQPAFREEKQLSITATQTRFRTQELQEKQEQETASEEAIQATLDELAEFVDFPANWDGYGAAKPSIQAIATASDLLSTAHQRFGKFVGGRIEPQLVAPIPDGGIEIDWGNRQTKLIVQVGPTGTLNYAYIDRRGDQRISEEIHNTSAEKTYQMLARILFSA